MDINNKTIIITGAARIGQEVARQLKEKGANLVITYFNDAAEAGAHGFGVQADVTKKADVENVIAAAKEKFGSVDALVHMAATYEKSPWERLSEADFDKNMAVIAKSAFLFGKLAGDEMLKNEAAFGEGSGVPKGKMIFFSDWSVLNRPYQEYLAYNAAKAAVVGLTKSFAKELAPHVLVNAIAPGPMLRPADLTDAENEEVLSKTLLNRWGGAEEIARGVVYLLEADFITGHVLTIDGGRTIA
ncbi:MAG TPA: SDR family oxidoreductase [Negativicutes bacterium]|nr:SDR family oxidoreductase [Negativicutes bacterium]